MSRIISARQFCDQIFWCCLLILAFDLWQPALARQETNELNGDSLAVPLESPFDGDRSKVTSVYVCYHSTLSQSDIDFIASLNNLTELWIGGNLEDEFVTFRGSISKFSKLKKLKCLFLCKEAFTDDDLGFVGQLPELEYLEFMAESPLGAADAAKNSLTDGCAQHLKKATALRSLQIIGGEFSDRFVDALTEGLRDLTHLDIGSDALTDGSLEFIADRCRNLERLRVSSIHFTDEGVTHLAKLNKLQSLSLYSKRLTDASVRSFKELVHLKHVALTIPSIESDNLQILCGLPKLEILALREPRLSDQQFALFENHATLQSAFLCGSELSEAQVLRVIDTMPSLRHLSLEPCEPTLQKRVTLALQSRSQTSAR